jgi:hypothetical protein
MVGVGYHVRRDMAAAVGERIWPRVWMGLAMPPSRCGAIQSRVLALLWLASSVAGSSVQRGRGQRIFEEDEDVTSRAPLLLLLPCYLHPTQAHKSESGRGFGAGQATARHELVSSLEVGMHSTAQKAQGGGGGHNGERRTRGDDSIVATDVRVLQVYIGVGVLVIY